MSNKVKLKRIVDLFSEGDVCYLGDDELGKPVCVWVQKITSLEEEEARMDGQSAITQFLLSVADPSHPEMQHLHMVMADWTDDELYEASNNHNYEKHLINAAADIDGDKEWQEKLDYLRRQPELLDDANVADDDPRREQIVKYNQEYMAAIDKRTEERSEEALKEIKSKGRAVVEEEFVVDYKDKLALNHYILESRISKLYFSVRECDAVVDETGNYDHKACDHSKRLLSNRGEVRDLPESVLLKINKTVDDVQVGARNVANFPKPPNSSESSAQQNEVGE